MFSEIFRREKVEMIPTFSWRNIRFKVKTNQCTHAQLSVLQRIRQPFRLMEIRLYNCDYTTIIIMLFSYF